jgi:hypothetical protein
MGVVAPGWPEAGRIVATSGAIELSQIASDQAGGVYLGWVEYTGGRNFPKYLQRIAPTGEPAAGWPPAGLLLSASWGGGMALTEDGLGGVYLAWTGHPPTTESEARVLVHRVTSAGTPHPSWPTGGVVLGEIGSYSTQLVTDGAAGLYAAWTPDVMCARAACIACPCPSPTFASHLSPEGALVPGWPAAGIQFGDYGAVASDAAGGLLVGTTSFEWSDAQVATRALAARVHPDGTPADGWSLSGNPVCSERRQQGTPSLRSDGLGGAFAAWIDYRTFEPVLYVSRLTAGSVAAGWPETGSIGAPAAVSPVFPALVSGNAGDAFVVWADERSGSLQLYAERARPGPAGPPAPRTGLGFTVTDIRPNPARGAFWATVSLPEPGIATLELYDVMGRRLESHQMAGGRPGVVQLNVAGNLPAGIYTLRLRQGSLPAAQRTSIARVAIVP